MLLLQKIHGHLALLAAAAVWHPVISLAGKRVLSRAARIGCHLASAMVVLATVVGWVCYPPYRELIKPVLRSNRAEMYLLFEVKEHLAFFALALALLGWYLVIVAPARNQRPFGLRPAIRLAYLLCALLMTVCCVIGVWVSSVHGFAYGI